MTKNDDFVVNTKK